MKLTLWNSKLKKGSNSPPGQLVKMLWRLIIALLLLSVRFNWSRRNPSLFYSIGITLYMPRSYHLTYIYLLSDQIMWPQHLKSYLCILLKKNRNPPAILMLSTITSNNIKNIRILESIFRFLKELFWKHKWYSLEVYWTNFL